MTPVLDPRRAEDVLRELLGRRAGYVPGFEPEPGRPGHALLQITAAQIAALVERLDQAPTKRGLALLDMLGVSLVPAQAARAPVVFEPTPGLIEATAPAGTRLGAKIPNREDPLVFETESSISIAASRLAEVTSVAPGRDAYAEHAAELAAGSSVTLFAGAASFAHELYLGHAVLLALSGRSEVEVELSLRRVATEPLRLRASWWDGTSWQPFAAFAEPAGDDDSYDGTVGLTASGVVRLLTPCALSKKRVVYGVETHWVRIAVEAPLAPGSPAELPEVERLVLRTVTERRRVVQQLTADTSLTSSIVRVWTPDGHEQGGAQVVVRDAFGGSPTTVTTDGNGIAVLPTATGGTYRLALGPSPADEDWLAPLAFGTTFERVDLARQHGLVPEKALSDGKTLDLTKAVQPLGPSPVAGAALYLACDDAFTKPGAEVTLVLGRPRTPEQEADLQGATYEIQINAARNLVKQIEQSLTGIAAALDALRAANGALGKPLPDLVRPGQSTAVWYDALKDALRSAVEAIGNAATIDLNDLLGFTGDVIAGIFGLDEGSRLEAEKRAANTAVRLSIALEKLGAAVLTGLRENVQSALGSNNRQVIAGARVALQAMVTVVMTQPDIFLPGSIPSFLATRPEDFVTDVKGRIADAVTAVKKAADDIRALVQLLSAFNPANLVAAHGGLEPGLTGPQMAWEYWDGGRWATLVAPSPGVTAANLMAPGVVRFTVKEGWEPVEIAGDTRRWLRARLAAGSYARLRLVAWTDTKSNLVNFLPVVEPRPPVLDGVEAFFRYVSPTERPERCLALNDAEWADHTSALAWPGPGFLPYVACRDTAPTLYLGFETPLPAGRIGVFFDVEERPDALPLAVQYEAWDGGAFVPVAVEDGTRGLTAPGIVHLVWPGDAGAQPSLVVRAVGESVLLAENGAGLRFEPGTTLWLADDRGGELVDVLAASEQELTLARAVSRPYAGSLLRAAPPARFGVPRTWLCLRFAADADPPALQVRAVLPNAVTAANVETIVGEILGGADGTPNQVLFFRRTPVLQGEQIEVRELEGARAAVDAPILRDELVAQGRPDAHRPVVDPATGKVTEVWVRWDVHDTLAFFGPDDRVCTIDRARGRLVFGDGRYGRVPPAGADNVRASYRAGGDANGNVATGAITSVLSGVLAQGVRNPLPAEGGADGETLDRIALRGPTVVRDRRQALTESDYEALALEASAAVARARALGATDESGRSVPGRVRLVVVPNTREVAPQPTPELRRQVSELILARAPATLAGALTVVGPRYSEVGVDATLRPFRPDDAASVREAARAHIAAFLHPLTGGPDGTGFAFGAELHASDLARLLRELPGVDADVSLAFVVDGLPQSERVALPPDRLPTAGLIRVLLTENT